MNTPSNVHVDSTYLYNNIYQQIRQIYVPIVI